MAEQVNPLNTRSRANIFHKSMMCSYPLTLLNSPERYKSTTAYLHPSQRGPLYGSPVIRGHIPHRPPVAGGGSPLQSLIGLVREVPHAVFDSFFIADAEA